MPGIGLIEDDAADQEEFDYADGKAANNDSDENMNSYDQSGANKKDDDDDQNAQAEMKEASGRESSSDIRSV